MEFTGERYCPQIKGEIAMEHYLRYVLAARLAEGRDVLDIASGEGYGSALLAKKARKVTGVDVSPEAVENSKSEYSAPNLEFLQGDAASIPLPDNSVDLITSFETIEHHDRQEEMMAELRRVLRPDGLLMLSSPDRAVNEDLKGRNPYHVRELYKDELTGLVGRYFKNYAICGQRTIFASIVDGTEKAQPVVWTGVGCPDPDSAANFLPDPKFFIILATDNEQLSGLPLSIMEGSVRDAEIFTSAQNDISNLKNDLANTVNELNRTCESLQESIRAQNETIAEVNRLAAALEGTRRENKAMTDELRGRQAIIEDMQNSRSWRMTAPLRYAMQMLREAKRRLFFYLRLAAQMAREKLNKCVPGCKTRIALISSDVCCPGHVYRMERLAAALLPKCHIDIIPNADLAMDAIAMSRACYANIVWIWRCSNTEQLETVVRKVHERGGFIIFDVDDLCFHPDYYVPEWMDAIRHRKLNVRELRLHGQAVFDLAQAADFCVGATTHLAQELSERAGKGAFTLRNTFDHSFRLRCVFARQKFLEEKDDNLVRIGYATGTATHQADLAVAAPALKNILEKYPNARLVLFRNIDLSEIGPLQDLRSRIEWRDVVSYGTVPEELARFDINIIPLQAANPFCNAKSELKFFEPALMRIPSIATPTDPFCQCIINGETGFLAKTTSDWEDALAALLDDPDLRNKLGSAAQRETLWRFGPEYLRHAANTVVDYVLGDSPERSKILSREINDRMLAGLRQVPVCDYEVIFCTGRPVSKVTVVIPLHNYENYIVETLNSVHEQSMENFDLVVVDDLSTDNSGKVALEWLKGHSARFSSVSLLANAQNAGLAVTRNVGFDYSESEFIMPLDADNLLLPQCIEKCSSLLESSDAAFAYPEIKTFGEHEGFISAGEWNPAILKYRNYIDAMAMVRKGCWAAVGGYTNQRLGWEDYDLWCKFLEAGFYGLFAGETLALYRVHSGSMLHTTTDRKDSKKIICQDMGARHPWMTLENIWDRLEARKNR